MNGQTLFGRLKDIKGSVTVVTVLALIVLIGFAALAVDVGYMMVRRNELQNIADTAALAATGELGAMYVGKPFYEQIHFTPPLEPLRAAARAVATATGVKGVTISDGDMQLGIWDPTKRTFTVTVGGPTAVRVSAHKDSAENGAFSTLLAGVVGIGTFNVSTVATASLTSLSTGNHDTPGLPVGISLHWFEEKGEDYCGQVIQFNPTKDSCAGWNVYTQTKADDNDVRSILQQLLAGTYQIPETIAGVTAYTFMGGDLSANTFDAMTALFNARRVLNDGTVDMDSDPNTWTTTVPVYDWPDCSNPNKRAGPIKIVGFTTVVISGIGGPSAKEIKATVLCNSVVAGPGGNGTSFGTYGSIPYLVQ